MHEATDALGDARDLAHRWRNCAVNPEDLMDVQETLLQETLARGRTLPAEWYTDPERFEREENRIFAANWNYIGRAQQVAKAGDFLTGRLGKVPVVIVRDEAGLLRAYANVCGHRGSELVLEKSGNRRTLQCHYHAWTWGLDGTLRAAPHCHEQEGFNKSDFPLTPLGVETFGPFIFINLGPATSSLAATLGQLPAILRSAGADIDSLKFRERREYAIQANWKVVVENFLECYHCAVSHPGFANLIDLDRYQVVAYDRCSVQRGPVKASARAQQNEAFTADEGREGIYGYVWPNFMLNVYPGAGNASTNLIVPIDEHHCVAVYEFFFSESTPEGQQRAMVEFIDQVQREDIVIVESVQRGLRSGFYKQGQLILSRENGIQHFQKLVFAALTGP
jgi:phenylpropionate dioxygenase-like ring-hydroxylating dioxygenase large terminal subunit